MPVLPSVANSKESYERSHQAHNTMVVSSNLAPATTTGRPQISEAVSSQCRNRPEIPISIKKTLPSACVYYYGRDNAIRSLPSIGMPAGARAKRRKLC
jgi:hypothetical protein